MSRLHDQFMGIKAPTDVLTFPLDLGANQRPLSGEIYVNIDHARRESRRRNLPLRSELLLYALHGMLHLSGYDDRTQRDFDKMHKKEDQILRQLGIGPVFSPDTGGKR
jgi:probable rRNA maturation factor